MALKVEKNVRIKRSKLAVVDFRELIEHLMVLDESDSLVVDKLDTRSHAGIAAVGIMRNMRFSCRKISDGRDAGKFRIGLT